MPSPWSEMPELRAGVQEYRRTTDFTRQSMPAGLRRAHRTQAGVWGMIRVEAGEVLYPKNGSWPADSSIPIVRLPISPTASGRSAPDPKSREIRRAGSCSAPPVPLPPSPDYR